MAHVHQDQHVLVLEANMVQVYVIYIGCLASLGVAMHLHRESPGKAAFEVMVNWSAWLLLAHLR